MATLFVDFQNGNDGNSGATIDLPKKTFAGAGNGDVYKYLPGTWVENDAELVINGVDNLTLEPADRGSTLFIDSYKTLTGSWSQVEPASIPSDDPLTPSGESGLWRIDNPLGSSNARELTLWPLRRDCLRVSLQDAGALTGPGFIANWRRNDGKYRRTNYIDTDKTTVSPSDVPTLEGQWSVGDNNIFMYTGSSTEDPFDAFGNVWWNNEAALRFINCDNLVLDLSGMVFISGGECIEVRVTDSGNNTYSCFADGLTSTNCYKGWFSVGYVTPGSSPLDPGRDDPLVGKLNLTLQNCTTRYCESHGIQNRFSQFNSVIQNNLMEYCGLGDPVGAYYSRAWDHGGNGTIVQDNVVRYVPYHNTWFDGVGMYVEEESRDTILRRNKIEWCKTGIQLGGSVGGTIGEQAYNNVMVDCGQMVRVIDAFPSNSHNTKVFNNTGIRIRQSEYQPWAFGDPLRKGSIDVHDSIVGATNTVEVRNNLCIDNEVVPAVGGLQGNHGLTVADPDVVYTETNNVVNNVDTVKEIDGSDVALDASSTTTTQVIVDDNGYVATAPALGGGLAIAGVTDSTDFAGLPHWPGTPTIGARTYYPPFGSDRGNLV